MRREDRVSREELSALIKKLKARAPLDKTDYQIITAVIRKDLRLAADLPGGQRTHRGGDGRAAHDPATGKDR